MVFSLSKNPIICAGIGILYSLILVLFIFYDNNILFFSNSREKAFLNSRWGMSDTEIMIANNKSLNKPEIDLRGIQDSDNSELFITNV